MSDVRKWLFRITAGLFMDNLSSNLYESAFACLWELVRNGACASMPGGEWIPRTGDVEVFLVKNHPMNPKGMTLVVLDHGSGFTQPAIDRWCDIGPSLADTRRGSASHGGAAQKRVGRFAGLALNKGCAEDHDPNAGFYIFTRTASQGKVRYVRMIPAEVERDQGVSHQELEPLAAELGPQRGIKGSFTAVVIPNPVFESHEEIAEGLRWFIPRKRELMFSLTVGGKPLTPPPLSTKLTVVQKDGPIEAYINQRTETDGRGGLWLTDAATGLRVAHAPRLMTHLPYPLWRADLLEGDIFLQGLLSKQDLSRASITPSYLKSAAWKRDMLYLSGQVVPKVNGLIGEVETFGRKPVDLVARSFVELAAKAYGDPDPVNAKPWDYVVDPPPPHDPKDPKPPGNPKPPRDPKDRKPPGDKRRPRYLLFRVGEKSYALSPFPLNAFELAQVDETNPQVVWLNRSGYVAMPRGAGASSEHFLLSVLYAIGRAEHPDDPLHQAHFVAEARAEFLKHEK